MTKPCGRNHGFFAFFLMKPQFSVFGRYAKGHNVKVPFNKWTAQNWSSKSRVLLRGFHHLQYHQCWWYSLDSKSSFTSDTHLLSSQKINQAASAKQFKRLQKSFLFNISKTAGIINQMFRNVWNIINNIFRKKKNTQKSNVFERNQYLLSSFSSTQEWRVFFPGRTRLWPWKPPKTTTNLNHCTKWSLIYI